MNSFLIILCFVNAIFAGIDFSKIDKLDWLKSIITTIIFSVLLFLLNSILTAYIVYDVFWGVVFILHGFSYLGIIKTKISYPLSFYMSVFLFLILSLALEIELNFLVILLFFYFPAVFITLRLFGLLKKKLKSSENVKQLLELNAILYGIFYFVIGITLATNRVEFLKRMAEIIFN